MMVAVAMPCPMHIVWSPSVPPVASRPASIFAISPAPVAPSGWPCAIAPPHGLSFAASAPNSLLPRERHAGERLVHLDPVEILDRHARALERAPGRRDDAVELERGIGADDDAREEARSRLQTVRTGGALVGDQDGGRAVGDLACVAGGDHAAGLAEDGLERGHLRRDRPARARPRPG